MSGRPHPQSHGTGEFEPSDFRRLGEHVVFEPGALVFHPQSAAARVFSGATITAIVITTFHTLSGGYASVESSLSVMATNAARIVPTAWAFCASAAMIAAAALIDL